MDDPMLVEARLLEGAGAVKAAASVTLSTDGGDLTILRVKVIQKDGKDPWVALPDQSYKDDSGEWRHLAVIEPSQRLKRMILSAVLLKYKELIGGAKQERQESHV